MHPLVRSKVSPMPNSTSNDVDNVVRNNDSTTLTPSTLTNLSTLNATPSEFVIFPRELHVEARAPHNRVVSTVDTSYADRRYTMV
jgi:hypothetical protein